MLQSSEIDHLIQLQITFVSHIEMYLTCCFVLQMYFLSLFGFVAIFLAVFTQFTRKGMLSDRAQYECQYNCPQVPGNYLHSLCSKNSENKINKCRKVKLDASMYLNSTTTHGHSLLIFNLHLKYLQNLVSLTAGHLDYTIYSDFLNSLCLRSQYCVSYFEDLTHLFSNSLSQVFEGCSPIGVKIWAQDSEIAEEYITYYLLLLW